MADVSSPIELITSREIVQLINLFSDNSLVIVRATKYDAHRLRVNFRTGIRHVRYMP